MYLLSQMASYLFVSFLLGVGVGYALWRAWGERETVAKYQAAEMRLAQHLANWQKSVGTGQSGSTPSRQSRAS